ncbi:cobalamin biosynthesis protein P47K [Alkalibaculum sp. M08DMB]|uniref:Cobalamin biosynthesis protein P47K n=1 Tax=Alkalibaculum sporogenes TaxID=2655001 RepID=A0A6A7K4L7_9FIRM|nr:GTP-binding protein [Alkalibaculum sporogenes]MPW24399.1 cobalamin biosynthesis protein P47K [Alkalibaculum sporogenes]
MKILILGGFLGSGKTSVVIQLAKYIVGDNPENTTKVVILENEIGEVSVDDKILINNGYEVANMFSGCVCCTMSGELVIGLHKIIRDFNPELIIMEATGVAYPHNIKETIAQSMPDINCIITCVTDAKRWKRLIRPMEMLLKDQLNDADVILINKVDIVDETTLTEVENSVRTYNNNAQFFKISASKQIDSQVFDRMLGNGKGA